MNCRVSLAALALAICTGASFAQDEGVSGAPRELSPVPVPDSAPPDASTSREGIEIAPLPPAPGATESNAPLSLPSEAPAPSYGAENDALGLLDDANGGLGGVLWHGTSRQAAVALLPGLPVATKSPAMNALARRLLLTAADPPSGHAAESFMAIRLERLYDAGLLEDVAALGARMRSLGEREEKTYVDALLLLGRSEEACGGASAARLESSDDYWLRVRTFCYAVEGNAPGISLTTELMRSQHVEDETFYALAAQIEEGAKPVKIKSAPGVEPVTLALIALAKAGPPSDILKGAAAPALRAVALGTGGADDDLRLEAAYRGALVGAVSPEELARLFDAQNFKPAQLKNPGAGTAKLVPELALALYYRAAQGAAENSVKVKIIADALAYGDAHEAFALYARLFAPLAEDAIPSPDLAAYAPQIARAMLFARRFNRVQDWYAIAESAAGQPTQSVNALQIRFAVAQPSQFEAERAQSAIAWLVSKTANLPPGDALRRRAVFEAGVLDALGFVIPPEARLQLLGPVLGATLAPPPAPLDTAAAGYRIAETVIHALASVGPDGPGAAPADAVIAAVGALMAVGLDADARAIALEALLAEPVGGS